MLILVWLKMDVNSLAFYRLDVHNQDTKVANWNVFSLNWKVWLSSGLSFLYLKKFGFDWKVNVVVWIRMTPIAPYSWILCHQWVELFKRIRRCGLIGGIVPLGVELWGFGSHCQAQSPSSAASESGCRSLTTAPAPCPPVPPAPCHDDNGPCLWNCKQTPNPILSFIAVFMMSFSQ